MTSGDESRSTPGSASRANRKIRLKCPCGESLVEPNSDALVASAFDHLREVHPDLADRYSREDILLFAY
ncbi:hypothetical protein PSU4_58260 [Pseudonocardia sulfidoxydans NBRC 16205]|uniref:DUF1059 domain-containing protein n=1 Tax=Pseudonocardia sulfidoxydans NBRC 16205 TaxID=1223511 RepID=A0A511DPW2_9PSEU|nr:hypothetical protein PSU4_58260 [Pseudonocardia sulfidoxydans NBRC 16205]